MVQSQPAGGGRRETRLLLVTIAISIGALLLLARFRFPDDSGQPSDPAPAPLERLAARAAYDELASTMLDLERRIAPRLLVLRVHPQRPSGAYIVAPRITPSRGVAILDAGEQVEALTGATADIIARDIGPGIGVFNLGVADDLVVTPRTGPPRPGPRYVVVVEGSSQGPTLRPVYVGRTAMYDEPRAAISLLSLSGLPSPLPRGAAVFTLEGIFLGLVTQSGSTATVVGADFLRAAAEAAQQTATRSVGDLGIQVQDPDPTILRAAGAGGGSVVSFVRPDGPAAGSLAPGDVIQSVDGTDTPDAGTFRHVERTRVPGTPTTIVFVRRGQEHSATYRAVDAAAAAVTQDHGIVGRGVPGAGIEVVAVQAGSAAERSGVRRGDLIVSIDGQAVSEIGSLVRIYRALGEGEVMLLAIERSQQHRIVALEKR